MLMATVLVSCSREESTESIENDLVTLYPIMNNEIETQVTTRAGADDYESYTGHRQNIYAEAVPYNGNTNDQPTGWFLPDTENDGYWFSRLNVHSGTSYYLYCYTSMPVAEGSMPTFNFSSSSNVTLTFSGFDIITPIDPLVSTASAGKLLCDRSYLDPAVDYPQLTDDPNGDFVFGKFDIGPVQSGSYNGQSATTKVFLALDHLFAKATMSFKVADSYNSIRTIKLIEANISTTQGLFSGNHSYSFVSRTFTLAQGSYSNKNLSIDLIKGASSTVNNLAASKKELNDNNEVEKVILDNDTTQLGWFCFLPHDNFPALDLTVKYNVYDKAGNLIRENQIATNKNLIRIQNPQKGTNYNITVTIKPTYLYQLSDEDVELTLTVEDS